MGSEPDIELCFTVLKALEQIPYGTPPRAPQSQSYLRRATKLRRTLPDVLKDLMAAASMTQAALAKEIGVNITTMSRIMNGHQPNVTAPTLDNVRRLCRLYQLKAESDLTRIENESRTKLRGGFYRKGAV